jgi:hypothetical protein
MESPFLSVLSETMIPPDGDGPPSVHAMGPCASSAAFFTRPTLLSLEQAPANNAKATTELAANFARRENLMAKGILKLCHQFHQYACH